MRSGVLIVITIIFTLSLNAQSRADLEERRKKTLEEINYVDNLLKNTSKQRNESLNAVKIIGKKLNLRESVISGMQSEISLLSDRIDLNTIAIQMMEEDLVQLKDDYARAVLNSFKTGKGNPEILYILSAKDFNQGYKRLKYLQQVTKFRREQAELITELKGEIENSKEKLQADLSGVSELKSKEEQQKKILQDEQNRKQKMVKTLNSKEKQLRQELEEKKKIAKRIENEISRLIEEERKITSKKAETPEQRKLSDSFAENKGKLPWPVDKGIITSKFGIHSNQVLKYVQEANIGIEITSSGNVAARSVFKGEVARVFSIQGANMSVMIRHGKYFTIYNNIINVKVKPGDKVETKQYLGDVYSDPNDSNHCVLKFMIFESKFQDPEEWIIKNY
jgi:septal ring factor EnvC (AmiA/AmiB activator)